MTSQVLITIDTEIGELDKYRPDAFEIFVEGKVNDKEVGYKFIMDILDEYGLKGEFFVDIYPYKQIGEDKFASLCQNITKRGHNVQLHTHPSMFFDKERIYMHQYSLEEQINILSLGKEKINEWVGKYPTVHRAGGYGINEDTLNALEEVGIPYDSSYFYGNGNCKFQSNIRNKPFKIGNITEIPITVFEKIISYDFFGIKIIQRKHFQKLDIRYGATLDEVKNVIINENGKDAIIVLFLHSFNFLSLPYNFRKKEYGKINVNEKIIRKFKSLLKWIYSQKKCSFATISNLKEAFLKNDACVKITKSENILRKLLNDFANKTLKIRKI